MIPSCIMVTRIWNKSKRFISRPLYGVKVVAGKWTSIKSEKVKTEVMLFGTKKRLNQQEREIDINYQSQPINTTNNCKYLGVQLDPSLNMQEHFNSICRKASSRIRLLKRIIPFITYPATLRIYQALIVPIITYCSLTNFYHQPYGKSWILALESRVCKLTNKDIPSVNKIFERMFKCLNDDVPNFEDYFEITSHGKGTRNNNNRILRTLKIKLESIKKTFLLQWCSSIS